MVGVDYHDRSVTLRHPHERNVGRLNHRSVLLQHIGAVATPGLTIFPNAEAMGCSTLNAKIGVSQVLKHHALGVEE